MFRTVCSLAILLHMALQVIGDPISIQRRLPQTCPNTGRKFICKDCYSLQLCNSGYTDTIVSCAAQYPGRPYCYTSPDGTNNTCVSTPSTCQWTEFNCPGVGYYPNLENCKSYYTCSKPGVEGALVRHCLYNSVYNVEERACKTNTSCYLPAADCTGQQKIIPYKPNKKYYVICQGAQPPILQECAYGSVFDSVTLTCELECPAEGHFANPQDRKKFIICVYNGTTMVKIDDECGDDEIFDLDNLICIFKG